MARILTFVVSFIFLFVLHPTSGQEADFFWSDKDLNQGAVNGPLSISAQPGDVVSLYLYYTTNGPSNQDLECGAIMDLATSDNGIIRFLNAESFNPPIEVQGIEIDRRWFSTNGTVCDGAGGEIGTVTDDFINEWGAFGLTSRGMIEPDAGGIFIDVGYDATADAFLFGRVDIEVIGPMNRCVQIQAGRGELGIVVGDGFDAKFFEPIFGSVVISVGEKIILGDVNNDQEINLLDVQAFIDAGFGPIYVVEADLNCDSVVDLLDVAPFVSVLSGNGLPVLDPSEENQVPMKPVLGDVNTDGFINLLDAECLVLAGLDCGSIIYGDVNMDGVVDLLDTCPFIEILLQVDQ